LLKPDGQFIFGHPFTHRREVTLPVRKRRNDLPHVLTHELLQLGQEINDLNDPDFNPKILERVSMYCSVFFDSQGTGFEGKRWA
jgi:hypothetical protein